MKLSVFLMLLTVGAEAGDLTPPAALMPRLDDHTFMWWAEGFPSHTPDAPWLRCVQTGTYAMVLDTGTLQVPHFGKVPGGTGYDAAVLGDNSAWKSLPAADLTLGLTVEGKPYRCTAGGKWSRFNGPRTIESGRFFQRADVTDLEFTAADGTRLNVDARFETAAWADRLGLILAARPGMEPIPAGEHAFGRVGGGFGLDGTNHLEIPHRAELEPERFTLELWAFVPAGYQVSDKTYPWLVCKNPHEEAEGNYGITIVHGRTQARMNIGGGRANAFVAEAAENQNLKIDAWNHLAMSYDGETLRLYLNGGLAGEKTIGRRRVQGHDGLAIGRRQDNSGDGFHFRGVVDEIRLHDRALTPEELKLCFVKTDSGPKPAAEWTFRADGKASVTRPVGQWKDASMEIVFSTKGGVLRKRWDLPKDQSWESNEWRDVSLALDPASFRTMEGNSPVVVKASEDSGKVARPVDYDAARGWHRVNLDGIEPIVPPGVAAPSNDAIERVKLVLSNPTDREQLARLMIEKTARGIRQRIGFPITGVSAILRDSDGNPTGIPVQLSKNWHNDPEGGVYAGQWFHGISQVRLPPASTIELELTLAYGHWGGVAAASHSQLCLAGWGSNQLWETSALGSWGESICYEPDQVQANCTITDMRPLMVRSMGSGAPWSWTSNVGGGDFFRFFDPSGNRIAHSAMRTAYQRQGPCLTEVTHAGRIGKGITHSSTVSLTRGDDVVRGIYRIRLDVKQPADFSRFVIFQAGADTYSYTGEGKMALGNESGLLKEWDTQWGGNTYRTEPMECTGRIPWVSLHQAVPRKDEKPGAWANRGIIIRSWKARLGGKAAAPWVAERGITLHQHGSSTLDILPPPGVTRLEPGDFVEATIEHVILPQFAKDYYGPNQELRAALEKDENTWRMVHREAAGNERRVGMKIGTLQRTFPSVTIGVVGDRAALTLTGGIGYVPLTFTGLSSPRGHTLRIDGQPLNQSIHGNDFWQTDHDAVARSWSVTYNVPVSDAKTHDLDLTAASDSPNNPVATVTGTPGCVAFWDFVKREPDGAHRFTAHVPPGATNDFALDAGNYVKDYWGEGRDATYADFPLLGRGPFGQAIRIRKEEDPSFRPFLCVPRSRLHDSSIDIKGAGKSVTVVVWAIRESGNHALAGIWHEGTDLKQDTTAGIRRVEPGQRQYALFAGLNKEGSACGHVSENGAKSFGYKYAMHKSNSGEVSPAVAADAPAEVLDGAWQCFAMTFDHERDELTGWLNGRASERWETDVKAKIPPIYNAWLQGELHRTPGVQPGEDATFPTDQFYNPPEDKPVSVRVLGETADERIEMREFRHTRVKVTLRKAADGTWAATARDLADVRLNPWWYPHDLYAPKDATSGGPFTIGRVIHSSRSVGFTGWIGGVAVFNRALGADEMKRLAEIGKLQSK